MASMPRGNETARTFGGADDHKNLRLVTNIF